MKKKNMILEIAVFITITFSVAAVLIWAGSEKSGRVKMDVVGDVLLDRGVKEMINVHDPAYPYEAISKILKKSDISIGNLEGPITDSDSPVLKKGNLIFKGSPLNVPFLYNSGFRMFNLANNHSMDYGTKGISETIRLLNNAGIGTFGAGFNKETAEEPKYVKINGVRIGFLGFSAFPPEGYFCFDDRPDIAHLDEGRLHAMIKAAKRNCDVLMVMFHWGEEFSFFASRHQKNVAHLACDSGADIVIGHHPHVLQGVEKYHGKFIFYSLGNFIFDRQIPSATDETGILKLLVSENKIEKISLLPIKIEDCKPRICSLEEARHISDRFRLYSKGMGARIEFQDKEMDIK